MTPQEAYERLVEGRVTVVFSDPEGDHAVNLAALEICSEAGLPFELTWRDANVARATSAFEKIAAAAQAKGLFWERARSGLSSRPP